MTLQERYLSKLDKCTTSLNTWKSLINDYLEDVDKETEIAKLKTVTQEYCIIDNKQKNSIKAIKLLEESILEADPNQDYNIDALYEEKLAEQDTENPTDHEIWQQLFCNDISIQEVKNKKKKDKGVYEQVDDSIMCSSSFTAPVDPISKKIIIKPVKNKKCNHIYDKQSIYDYIRQSKRKAKCPYVGCKNDHLFPADLQEDGHLEEKISQYLQAQQTQESDSDDESD